MLRERERAVLLLGSGAAALILLLSFVVIPGVSRTRSLARSFEAARSDLEELRGMLPELSRLESEVRRESGKVTGAANAPEPPHARIQAAIQETGLPPSVFSLKSGGTRKGEFFSEESFEIRGENLTYRESVRLLSRLEGGSLPVVVRSASLKSRFDDPRYLDASIRVGWLTPAAR